MHVYGYEKKGNRRPLSGTVFEALFRFSNLLELGLYYPFLLEIAFHYHQLSVRFVCLVELLRQIAFLVAVKRR